MKIEQIYTGCIAHAAYYIESNGEAAVFDPLREVGPYLQRAEKDGAQVKYVFETHFHADFVSGHLDLAKKSGAAIVFGPTAKPGFDAIVAEDNQVFKIGNGTVTVIHTPGHTMESSCYLVKDENGKMLGLISGDTLFIGDVGRPDLAQHVIADLTQEKLASHLYDSLRNKIMPLPDDLIIYPNHGAGSACGKNMSKETTDTLGNQKRTNYALRPDMTREEFVAELLDGLTAPPSYFPKNVLMNIKGYESLDSVMDRAMHPLNPAEFEITANATEALILDVRDPQTFAKGFIPNSINIGLEGQFAPWVGTLIPDINQEILLVTEPGKEEEAVTRLSRIGYDHTIGYLQGGIQAWKDAEMELDTINSIHAQELAAALDNEPSTPVFDVRRSSEYKSEHVVNFQNTPLDNINDHLASIPKEGKVYIHCAGGYRSMMFVSILRSRGWNNLIDVAGGFKALKDSGKFTLTDYVCPTTLL